MEFIHEYLSKIGIRSKLIERGTRKGMYYIMVSRFRNIIIFYKRIGFRLEEDRQNILEMLIKYYSVHPNLAK